MKLTIICFAIAALYGDVLSLSAQDKDIKNLAGTFGDALANAGKKTVAVADFTDLQGNVTELGRYLAEQLSVALAIVGKRIDVVDRIHLKALIQEHKLNASGLIDPATARQLGAIAGIDVLCTGTLTPFGDSVQLAVKALDASTARIITASTTDIAKTKAIDELLGRGIRGTSASGSGNVTELNQPSPLGASAPKLQAVKTGKYEFAVQPCRRTAGGIVCVGTITSQGSDGDLDVRFHPNSSPPCRAIDIQGREYFMAAVQLGGKLASSAPGDNASVKNKLTSDIPTQIRVTFENVPEDVASFRLLEIAGYDYASNRVYRVSLRDVAVLTARSGR